MKRKIAIVLAVAMAAACLCLAGCSGANLTEEDFVFYDENGNRKELWENESGMKIRSADYSSQTSRGIKLGSTLEEVEEAYADVWGTVQRKENEAGERYTIQKDKMRIDIFIAESSGKVEMITISIEP